MTMVIRPYYKAQCLMVTVYKWEVDIGFLGGVNILPPLSLWFYLYDEPRMATLDNIRCIYCIYIKTSYIYVIYFAACNVCG